MKICVSFRGALLPPIPHQRLCPWTPLGAQPPDSPIGSRSRVRHKVVPLIKILNPPLIYWYLSDYWKSAIVVPEHKKGDIYDLNNYRSINLLPVISKVFERLMESQLRTFIESYDILNDAHHGDRKGRSCEIAFLQLAKCLFSL